ncbi:glycoside hydrolase family 3 N-terminal domain-containing protein [Streptomyces sp. NPDC096094]|uniref:glycoside hydrolase family 3 protein n=1 Tax=Streptomyces sp. NPDC096094 TaxID=3366073 RepID=UPI0038198644
MTDLNALVRKMDLDEKIAQLNGMILPALFSIRQQPSVDLSTEEGRKAAFFVDVDKIAELRPHGLGHLSLSWMLPLPADGLRRVFADVQRKAREVSRFGIGALIHAEGLNGLVHGTGIQFPTAWAQAATWMPDLIGRSTALTSAQFRDYGIQVCFSPVLDLARDPRWGRVHETFGEDQELAAQMGVAFIRGIHGSEGDTGVLATGKHFLGYASSDGALNQARTSLGRRQLTDEYAVPFRRAIDEAGLGIVMNSYNEIDGVPAAANRWLLTDLLRDRLGFRGLVVSDYDAVTMLHSVYHTARGQREAAAQAVSAGLDVELPADESFHKLREAVEAGLIGEEAIDTAVGRVLAVKRAVNLVPGHLSRRRLRTPEPLDRPTVDAVGREIAEHAVTLLQNDGTLPLRTGAKVAVVGHLANELRIHFGAYTDVANAEIPLAMQLIKSGQVPGIDPEKYIFTELFNTRIPGIGPRFETQTREQYPDTPTLLGALTAVPGLDVTFVDAGSPDATGSVDAETVLDAVRGADVVVAVVGERTGWAGEHTAGEGQNSARLLLPGDQHELVSVLARAEAPLVTVLVTGRPLVVPDIAEASAAVLLAPLLGAHGPAVVADILTGAVEPGGRLPSTFPRHVGQIPLHHNHPYGSGYSHPTGRRTRYNDLDRGPLYPFGHGLGYADLHVTLQDATLSDDGTEVVVRAWTANRGDRGGSTVVQVYARDEHGSVVRPVRQLLAFQRVVVPAGDSVETVLRAPLTRLFYTLPDGTRGMEDGDVTVLVGTSSEQIAGSVTLTVSAQRAETG